MTKRSSTPSTLPVALPISMMFWRDGRGARMMAVANGA